MSLWISTGCNCVVHLTLQYTPTYNTNVGRKGLEGLAGAAKSAVTLISFDMLLIRCFKCWHTLILLYSITRSQNAVAGCVYILNLKAFNGPKVQAHSDADRST